MKKILIVDDQNFIRTILKKQLEAIEDVAVIEAANGNEALGKAKVANPSLILLDLIMPNKDGFEALKELKENPKTKDIPVVIVTAVADEESLTKIKQLGAEEIVNKSDMDKTDFVGLVKKYL